MLPGLWLLHKSLLEFIAVFPGDHIVGDLFGYRFGCPVVYAAFCACPFGGRGNGVLSMCLFLLRETFYMIPSAAGVT